VLNVVNLYNKLDEVTIWKDVAIFKEKSTETVNEFQNKETNKTSSQTKQHKQTTIQNKT
jgi:hypothetical protein